MNTEKKPWTRTIAASQQEVTAWHRDTKANRTGFLGVRQVGRRFYASIRDTRIGKKVYLGSYATPGEAALAYDARARALYGHGAVTNFGPR